jgi:hypothetical protein
MNNADDVDAVFLDEIDDPIVAKNDMAQGQAKILCFGNFLVTKW